MMFLFYKGKERKGRERKRRKKGRMKDALKAVGLVSTMLNTFETGVVF